MSTFTIDFFELCFLAEACIPPRPIARTMFWEKLINEHYYSMTTGERLKLYEWIIEKQAFDTTDKYCLWFEKRFNPKNQYKVTSVYEGKESVHETFSHEGRYHTAINKSILPEYITKIEP
jgi:hypothetical protein